MIAPGFLPEVGGSEIIIHQISKRLVARGFRVFLLTKYEHRDYAMPPMHEYIDGVEVFRIPPLRKIQRIASLGLLGTYSHYAFVPPLVLFSLLVSVIPL